MPRLPFLALTLACALGLLLWAAWPDATGSVQQPAPPGLKPPALLALGGGPAEAVAAATLPRAAADCSAAVPLPPHEEAL
ncbi:MAG: hypothetical protein ACK44A_01205, partial [Roseateles sp.]